MQEYIIRDYIPNYSYTRYKKYLLCSICANCSMDAMAGWLAGWL